MLGKKKKKEDTIDIDINDAESLRKRLQALAQKSTASEQEKKDLLLASSLLEMLISIYASWSKSKKTVKKLLGKIFGNRSEKRSGLGSAANGKSNGYDGNDQSTSNNKSAAADETINGNEEILICANEHSEMDSNTNNNSENKSFENDIAIEKTKTVQASNNANENDTKTEKTKPKRAGGDGRNSVEDYPGGIDIHIHLDPRLMPGAICPECGENKLYHVEPIKTIRLIGHAPVTAMRFILDRSGCVCGMIFTAKVPENYQDLYNADKYGPSAIATMIIYKNVMGVPYGLLEKIQAMRGVPLPSSTQVNQFKKYALEVIKSVMGPIRYLAANAYLLGFDDTTIRSLEKRTTADNTKTTRGHGTAVLAHNFDNQDTAIVIYDFDLNKHAGNVVIDLLKLRKSNKDLPLLISDGLECYQKSKKLGIDLNCNSHARRKVMEEDPKQESYVGLTIIMSYQEIYSNDRYCKDNKLSDSERMNYHREHSKDSFEKIKTIFQVLTGVNTPEVTVNRLKYEIPPTLHRVESNDDLHTIAQYFLSRYEALSKVLWIPGVPLDTNYVERAIKTIIRIRKNSLFFANLESAKYSGEVLSLLETTNANRVNVFIYLEFIIAHRNEVIKNPKNYLPWLYDKDDEYKARYWREVEMKNLKLANSSASLFAEQTHSDTLVELQESG